LEQETAGISGMTEAASEHELMKKAERKNKRDYYSTVSVSRIAWLGTGFNP
jgi:hypothetical protein